MIDRHLPLLASQVSGLRGRPHPGRRIASADGPDGRCPPSTPGRGTPSIKGRKPIAVVRTVYRPLSHAYHIAGRFLHGYARDGKLHVPKHYVRSLYVDQTPDNDLSRDVGQGFGVRARRAPWPTP